MKKLNLTGTKHNRLLCIGPAGIDIHGNSLWLFRCDCGNQIVAIGSRVKNGYIKSCGCLPIEKARDNCKKLGIKSKTHGVSGSKQYGVWCAMLRRCENKNVGSYKYYGGRGIKVCKRWHSFENFWKDMGSTYRDGLEIDRIDNNGNYEPKNCRWVTKKEQMNNCRRNKLISFGGKSLTMSEWQEQTGISQKTIRNRLLAGWSVRDTLTIKPKIGRNRFTSLAATENAG